MLAKNLQKRTTVVQNLRIYQNDFDGLVSSSKAQPKIMNG